jgi:pyrimidine deaminase RibD-like protein
MRPLNDALNQVDYHYEFARLAVDKAKLCLVDATASNPPPRVGIVIAMGDVILGWAAKGIEGKYTKDGEMHSFSAAKQEHAEQALLAQLGHIDLTGAAAYITLEPCTKRKNGISCADLLVTVGLSTVYIGNCDPNPDVGALAWERFHNAGIAVRDFPGDLRNEARRDNAAFFRKFRWSHKNGGSTSFDYEANGGQRTLGRAGAEFHTKWTNRGPGSIYALDYAHNVCLAKHCATFDHVDDPGRWMEDSHYTKAVNVGEIVIFQNERGFALVKVLSITPRAARANSELHIAYELRYL